MGQSIDKFWNPSLTFEPQTSEDEISYNGLIIKDIYIPEELLFAILSYVDYKALLTCQLVCKCWNSLIQNYVWRKKAEMALGHSLSMDKNASWITYYLICAKMPFYRNLIKNDSIDTRFEQDWEIINSGGNGWITECPPIGIPPLPEDPIFNGKNYCFSTSYDKCLKFQVINLVEEGFTEHILDNVQPTIKISEYYGCRWDCSAVYKCKIELLSVKLNYEVVMDSYNFIKLLENGDQNTWFKFEHEFKNYGKGLRKIKFIHGGQDRRFWNGHYGSKMAGACVCLEIPEFYKK